MKGDRIFLSSPHMSEEGYELQYIQEAFDSNWIAPLGHNVDEFEKELSLLLGIHSAVALASGTAAIHMALKAAGVEENDIVFCQSLTFSASANPIIYLKAIPVFIDSDYVTWNMDPKILEQAFEKYQALGKLPKAVIIVHLYGLVGDMDQIVELCNQYGVTLIEDAAESLGTTFHSKQTGTLGKYGVFSFNGNKIITTSGGGMLVSNDEDQIRKVKFWSSQARDPARHYEHSELGFNYRMSNIVAGIGRGQLKILTQRIEKKKEIFEFYQKEFRSISEISMMPVYQDVEPNYWLTCIRLEGRVSPLQIILALEHENIEARPIWKPMHLQPYYKNYEFIGMGISEDIFTHGVCLPSDTKMTEEDLTRITAIIKGLYL